jgi:toxin ParE1/3/4
MRIRRSPRAIRDVDEIWQTIARDDEGAATRMVERFATATARLADFPLSAPARPEIGPDVRSVVVGRYLMLYRIEHDRVEIVRVVHGAREITGLLDG